MFAKSICIFVVLVFASVNNTQAQSPETKLSQMKVFCKGEKPWGVAVYMPEDAAGIFQFVPNFCVGKTDDYPAHLERQKGVPPPTTPPRPIRPEPKSINPNDWTRISK